MQRALANVPTYMIFDDHDVTDDFFLNPMWRDRVLTSRLGQAVMRNAMLAYALFQDWGNDPVAYETDPKAELLSLVPRLFPEGQDKGPDPTVADRAAILFGHHLRNDPTPDGRYASVTPPLLWHFSVDGPKHRVVVLDNRTRRSYAGAERAAGNVSAEAMTDQIPLPPLPAGREILVVVAPLAGDRAAGARRPRGAALVPAFRRDRGAQDDGRHLADERHRPAGHGRHQPGRDRGLDLRRADLRAPAGAAGALRARGDPVGRRALLGRVADELLARRGDAAGAVRAVHLERAQERDAAAHHLRRPLDRDGPADGARQPRDRAAGLGPAAGRHGGAASRHERARPRAGDAGAAADGAGAAADLGLAGRPTVRAGRRSRAR